MMRPSDEELEESAIKWLHELEHHPTEEEFKKEFGHRGLTLLKEKNDIIIDDDGEVILVAITNPKLQKLIDESVLLSDLPAKGEDNESI